MRNEIPELTKFEIDYIIANANFTKDEKSLFLLRNEERTMEECAEIINVSNTTIYRISKKMKRKINKLLDKE